MPVGAVRPWVLRQVDQHGVGARSAAALQIVGVVPDHHRLPGGNAPAPQFPDPDRLQRQLRQRVVVAGQDAQPATAGRQRAQQLHRARRRQRVLGQRALVIQQPRTLGLRRCVR
ncbi:hypothetical protein G6F24_017352 [Rhizopus arrhizus]|nr:hypothetical protein G6F24_017352 [Rhizopus arrhizus]